MDGGWHTAATVACAGLVIGALAAFSRAGDPDVADFLLKKAEKALRAKDYESAASDFRRARDEYTPLPLASYGLGVALEKLERESEAIAAYRQCVAEVDEASAPAAQRRAARRASSALRRLRRRYKDLDRATQAFLKELTKFVREHKKSDPKWARTACETILRIEPSHREARRVLDELVSSKPKPQKKKDEDKPKTEKGWGSPLVEGDDLPGWSPGIRPPWTCRDRLITVDAERGSGDINWMDDVTMKGRFEFRAEARVVRDGGRKRTYGIFLGNGKDRWHGVLIQDDDAVVLVEFAPGGTSFLKDATPRGFKPAQWHKFRIVVDRGDLSVFLDGARVLQHAADDRNAFRGKLGLFAQKGRFEFRNLRWKKQ